MVICSRSGALKLDSPAFQGFVFLSGSSRLVCSLSLWSMTCRRQCPECGERVGRASQVKRGINTGRSMALDALFKECNLAGCLLHTGRSELKHACALAQGKACNVAKSGDVGSLANYARDTLGTVDLWQVPPHALYCATNSLKANSSKAQAVDDWQC